MATEKSKKSRALQKDAQKQVMLAHKYNPGMHLYKPTLKRKRDISNWCIYDKIDGVRATLQDRSLVSRTGRKFSVPTDYIEELKDHYGDLALDGELIHVSNKFDTTVSIVRDQTKKNNMHYWKDIVYIVFDIIDTSLPFKGREEKLESLDYTVNTKHLKANAIVTSNDTVNKELTKAIALKKEGLIIRNPEAVYEYGRSHNLLKVKEFSDEEVTVKSIYKGEGKHKGRAGGVVCLRDSGEEFRCGTGFSDEQRENPPKVGDRITVRYFELTKDNIPRFPIYIGVRDYE